MIRAAATRVAAGCILTPSSAHRSSSSALCFSRLALDSTCSCSVSWPVEAHRGQTWPRRFPVRSRAISRACPVCSSKVRPQRAHGPIRQMVVRGHYAPNLADEPVAIALPNTVFCSRSSPTPSVWECDDEAGRPVTENHRRRLSSSFSTDRDQGPRAPNTPTPQHPNTQPTIQFPPAAGPVRSSPMWEA